MIVRDRGLCDCQMLSMIIQKWIEVQNVNYPLNATLNRPFQSASRTPKFEEVQRHSAWFWKPLGNLTLRTSWEPRLWRALVDKKFLSGDRKRVDYTVNRLSSTTLNVFDTRDTRKRVMNWNCIGEQVVECYRLLVERHLSAVNWSTNLRSSCEGHDVRSGELVRCASEMLSNVH